MFALDIADFQHDDSGDLKYTPGWIFPICPSYVGCQSHHPKPLSHFVLTQHLTKSRCLRRSLDTADDVRLLGTNRPLFPFRYI